MPAPDPLATQVMFEQFAQSMTDIAKVIGDYRRSLRHEGFTRQEALAIIVGFQAAIFTKHFAPPQGE